MTQPTSAQLLAAYALILGRIEEICYRRAATGRLVDILGAVNQARALTEPTHPPATDYPAAGTGYPQDPRCINCNTVHPLGTPCNDDPAAEELGAPDPCHLPHCRFTDGHTGPHEPVAREDAARILDDVR